MADFGKVNTLKVNRFAPPGAYLQFNEEEVLMPNKYMAEGLAVDDEVDVFIYKDSEDRLVATTLKPLAQVGEFAALEVVDTAPFGAFLEWGLEKHLLVPKREMQDEMRVGRKYVVKVVVDHLTERIVGVAKLNAFIFDDAAFDRGAEVAGLVVSKTDLGYKVLVESKYWGLLYSNEVFKTINQGDSISCFVRKVREDGKLDLSIRNPGEETQQSDADQILELLKMNEGSMNVSDKSDPELIKETFGLSKKAFKKALGTLYKQKLISIDPQSISLI
jgi:uncharacterized protein